MRLQNHACNFHFPVSVDFSTECTPCTVYTVCHYLKHPISLKLIVNISQDLVGSVAWDPETLSVKWEYTLDEKPSLFYILLFTPRATLAYPVYIPACCKEERGSQGNSGSYPTSGSHPGPARHQHYPLHPSATHSNHRNDQDRKRKLKGPAHCCP